MSLTRRQFVRRGRDATLVAAFGSQLEWLAACGEETRSADWEELAQRLDGELIRPGQRQYGKLSPPFNHRYDDIHPAGISVCDGESDVRECILWAREQEQPVAIRSGGHNYAGYSTGPGLVIDLANLDEVEVDERGETVTIGPGATNVEVYAGLTPHGVAISAGRCPTVCLGGLVLGGGFGFSSRKLGLTSDSLLESQMVDANGELLTLSDKENADLFWAIRGAGGGNFGVTTRHRFRTQPVGDVAIYDISWEWHDGPAALGALQDVIAGAPDEFSCRMGGGATGDPRSEARTELLRARPVFRPGGGAGGDPRARVIRRTPDKRLLEERTFREAKNYFFHNVPSGSFAVKSSYASEPLSGEAIEVLFEEVAAWPGSSNPDGAGFAIFAWGGEMNRPAPDATAFVHRDELLLLAFDTAWDAEDDTATVDANVEWLDRLYERIRPHLSPAAYQNFIDPSLEDWESAYYGSNLERLTDIKAKHDPDDFFAFAQAIPT